MKKSVDADSRESAAAAVASRAPSTSLESILDQVKKKQKLSVLDKTKKDWGGIQREQGSG